MSARNPGWRPLADRLRPRTLEELVGQPHLLAPGKPLHAALAQGALHSAILWGPPGTGKTTLARLLARRAEAHFIGLSAVLAGVKDVRTAVSEAQKVRAEDGRLSVLFLDEVHRFNKSQQDAFLPYVEEGTILFIGATTENPSFALNNALLSRARTYVLRSLNAADIRILLDRALADSERGLGEMALQIEQEQLETLALAADGDARRGLNLLELAADVAVAQEPPGRIDAALVEDLVAGGTRRFDRGGDQFYDQISALHKSVRGSDPDAALYWFARMLDGGCDMAYLARRLVRIASEDIGLADPRALQLALDGWQSWERLGSPEGDLALAEAVVFMACAAKSNAVYMAFAAAQRDAAQLGTLDVPMHLRNAPTRLQKQLGAGAGYRYDHDEGDAHAAGQRYFPEDMPERTYYHPAPRGLEIRIAEKLEALRAGRRKKK